MGKTPGMETKSWYTSRGMWGALATVILGAAGIAGYTFTEADTTSLTDLLMSVGVVASGALAWWGRLKAATRIR